MNKIKKVLFLLISTVMANSFVVMNVNSNFITMAESFTAPAGYEEHMVTSDGVVFKDADSFSLYYLHGFQYNRISLQLNGSADWDSIYNEYWVDLGFDYSGGSAYSALLYDKNEAAGDPRTPTDIEDKSDAAADICTEMYKAGLLESAEYTHILATLNHGGYFKEISIARFNGTEEELKGVVADLSTDVAVSVDDSNAMRIAYVDLSDTDMTYDDIVEVQHAIETAFPDCTVSMSFYVNDVWNPVSTTPINLLTAIIEEESCDINQSGTPDLDDASLLLTHYANTAAGIATAAEADTSSYDVNGDGTVDLDDALKILTVYAELAAGLR